MLVHIGAMILSNLESRLDKINTTHIQLETNKFIRSLTSKATMHCEVNYMALDKYRLTYQKIQIRILTLFT